VLGVTAGYSFDDHFMVIVGGALPTPDDWSGINGEIFGAYSFGVKIGVQPKKELHVAAGYQYGRSIYDQASTPDRESEIRVHAPYVAASWGDDDRRVSVTGGYALKRHATLSPVTVWGQEEVQEYDRNAWFAGVGGDWRIGRHWKVVAEVATMETAGVVRGGGDAILRAELGGRRRGRLCRDRNRRRFASQGPPCPSPLRSLRLRKVGTEKPRRSMKRNTVAS